MTVCYGSKLIVFLVTPNHQNAYNEIYYILHLCSAGIRITNTLSHSMNKFERGFSLNYASWLSYYVHQVPGYFGCGDKGNRDKIHGIMVVGEWLGTVLGWGVAWLGECKLLSLMKLWWWSFDEARWRDSHKLIASCVFISSTRRYSKPATSSTSLAKWYIVSVKWTPSPSCCESSSSSDLTWRVLLSESSLSTLLLSH